MQIVIADVSMSLDNVLAVAGAAREHPTVLIFGLVLSIALMGIAASLHRAPAAPLPLDRLCRPADDPLCRAENGLLDGAVDQFPRSRSAFLATGSAPPRPLIRRAGRAGRAAACISAGLCYGAASRWASKKTEPKMSAPRVSFVSLGCPKALVDSERIITRLRAEGYEIARNHDGADLVVVNTCGFLDSARDKSLRPSAGRCRKTAR